MGTFFPEQAWISSKSKKDMTDPAIANMIAQDMADVNLNVQKTPDLLCQRQTTANFWLPAIVRIDSVRVECNIRDSYSHNYL